MKFLKAYDVEILRLKEGLYNFSFDVGDSFFSEFEDNDIVTKGRLLANVLLKKETGLIEVLFDINGRVELICDRSLEKFDYSLQTAQTIVYKYGAEEKEVNEEIYLITRDTPKINLAQLIYEFILLAIPVKKIHPDHWAEMDVDTDEREGMLVYSSEPKIKPSLSTNDGEATDPRWEILKKLKKKD